MHLVHLLKVLFEGKTFFLESMKTSYDEQQKNWYQHTKKVFAFGGGNGLQPHGQSNLAECI